VCFGAGAAALAPALTWEAGLVLALGLGRAAGLGELLAGDGDTVAGARLVPAGAGLVTAWVCAAWANRAVKPTAAAVLSWAAKKVSRDRWRRPLLRAASAGSSSQVR
jgi:hypothetical protein